jgi:hypothetical protein
MPLTRHAKPETVKRVELFCVESVRGDGSPINPRRPVFYYYYALDGRLLACLDTIDQALGVCFVPQIKCPKCLPPSG